MLSINTNIMASNAARHLGRAYDNLSTSVERLSSGLRINSAKDDAAGLAVRELIRADIAVMQQGSRNALDGISLLQTMEGAMGVMDENLTRMMELAEQSATGSYSDAQRSIMNDEFAEMAAEIDRITGATKFNDISLLNSNTGTVKIHVGSTETIDVSKVNMSQSGLSIETGNGEFSIMTSDDNAFDGADSTALTLVAGNNLIVTISFIDADGPNQSPIAVTFAADDTYTLQEVCDAINAISQNPDPMYDSDGNKLGYAAAEIVETDGGKFKLEISALDTDMDSMTIVSTGAPSDGMTGIFGEDETADLNLMAGSLFQKWDPDANGGLGDWVDDTTGGTGAGLNILTVAGAENALTAVTAAINTKDEARASFGYKMKRLESTISVLNVQAENLSAAESRISDVDVATEMAELTRNQVLTQAGISMLTQANAMPQLTLALLR